jgi:hypothetical protein
MLPPVPAFNSLFFPACLFLVEQSFTYASSNLPFDTLYLICLPVFLKFCLGLTLQTGQKGFLLIVMPVK